MMRHGSTGMKPNDGYFVGRAHNLHAQKGKTSLLEGRGHTLFFFFTVMELCIVNLFDGIKL